MTLTMNDSETQERFQDLEIFHEVSQSLLMQLDEEIVLGLLCQLTVTHYGLRLAWYAHVLPDDPYMVPEYAYGDAIDMLNNMVVTRDASPTGRGAMGQAARTNQPVANNDLQESSIPAAWREAAAAHGIASSASFPLLFDQNPLGVLSLYAPNPGYFNRERMQLFQSLANVAAIALHNSSLHKQTHRRMAEVSTLFQASQRLQMIQPLHELAAEILALLRRNLDFAVVTVRLLDSATSQLRVFAATSGMGSQNGAATDPVIADDLPLGVGLPGRVVEHGRTIRLGDVRGEPWYAVNRPATRSVMCVPVKVQGAVLGLITVESSRLNAYNREDQQVLETIAAQFAVAMHNARLVEQLTSSSLALQLQVNARTADLQRLNDRMAAVLHTIQEGILLIDTNGLIDNTNPAFNRMFDYAPDVLFEQPFFTVAGPADVPNLRVAFEHVIRTGERRNLQIQGLRSDGSQFDADVTLSRINHMEKYVLLTIRDITAYKTVERLKDQFISTVSHELRTPTTSIVLSANSLRQHYLRMNEKQRSAAIERIATQAEVLADMVEGILDISRIEARMTQRGETSCNLEQIVRQVSDEFQPDLNRKNQRLELDIDSFDYAQTGTTLDYSRIWRNLISNAIKYSPESAVIQVRLGKLFIDEHNQRHWSPLLNPGVIETPEDLAPGSYFVSQVEDRGRGIPEAEQDQLFLRFFRGWASQSSIPGTGLGLALVKELLHLYEGDISVHSIVNQGSTFSFWLPARGAAIS